MTELLIRARRAVVDDAVRPAVVHVSGGVIVEVGNNVDEPPPAGAAVVELADDEVLLPGLVDTHVHVNEPGRTHWEGFATATAAARAGGVTTLLDMPLNSLPPTLSAAALDVKRSAAVERCQIDVGFWGGAVPDNLADLPGLFAAGVFGVKCFLQDSGVPEFPPLDDAGLLRACELIAGLGGLLAVHAEDPAVLGAAPAATRPGLPGVRLVPAAGRRGGRDRTGGGRSGHHGVSGAHRAHLVGGGGRGHRGGQTRWGAHQCRDLSALPDLGRRRDPGRGTPVQVLPADPGRGRAGRPLGRSGRRGPRHRGERSLAGTAGGEAARHR